MQVSMLPLQLQMQLMLVVVVVQRQPGHLAITRTVVVTPVLVEQVVVTPVPVEGSLLHQSGSA